MTVATSEDIDRRTNGIDGGPLKAFIDRIEREEGEKASIVEGIGEIYSEAKAQGFDPKIMRKIVALRKKAASARKEEAEIMSLYMSAIGMQGELPL